MSSAKGRQDPVTKLVTEPFRGGKGTEVLARLRDADLMETQAVPMPVVSRETRGWFRGDPEATPWGGTVARRPAPAKERAAEKTGKLRIPALFAFDALRQEIGMQVRDKLGELANSDLLSRIAIQTKWRAVAAERDLLKGALADMRGEEVSAREEDIKAERELHDELLMELDAFGLTNGFPNSVARSLGSGMAHHRMTPWGALAVLREQAGDVHWTPPARPA